ncbi:hypothetical protein BZL30_3869 [Mycobacterium kansasii]|uniref:GDT1 family protein n=1 Tax=Mycobacterium kansasii TaxID=1768 RepID=A0A1V3X9F1_MYCKA|nr:hypothetical protein BZL30_3869 [Mycobacterium kansasii]
MVFVAELGDRSQLVTMTYALRFRWWVVIAGVAIASFTVHGSRWRSATSWAPRSRRGR